MYVASSKYALITHQGKTGSFWSRLRGHLVLRGRLPADNVSHLLRRAVSGLGEYIQIILDCEVLLN
jgi:hypothetical protein